MAVRGNYHDSVHNPVLTSVQFFRVVLVVFKKLNSSKPNKVVWKKFRVNEKNIFLHNKATDWKAK